MKRKLKINRETLRNLVDESLRDAGGASGTVCIPTLPCSLLGSCAPPCTLQYTVCVHCQ